MSKAVPDWQAYIDAVAPTVGLEIRQEWKLGVASFIALAFSNASLFADLPFDDAKDEAAPVFRPGDAQ